jgi:hemerythrin
MWCDKIYGSVSTTALQWVNIKNGCGIIPNMAHISWRDEYSVNVKLIDEQHKHFLAVMDEVYDAFESLSSANIMGHVIEELIDYTNTHFITEEHKLRHQEFTAKVLVLKSRYQGGETDLIAETIDMLENWLIQHIMTYDKKYTACFNEHGLY